MRHRGIGSATAAIVLALLLLGSRQRAAAGPAEGAYHKGDLERARRLYEERLRKEPGDLKARYNLGNVLYRSKQLQAAEDAFRSAMASPDPEVRSRAAHNLGNARLQAGQIDGAIGAYEEALRAEPGNADSKYNLELALRMREMKPPEQKNSNDQQKQGQQGQEQRQQQEQQQDEGKAEDQKQSGQQQQEQQQQGQEQQRSDQKQEQAQGGAQAQPAPGDFSKDEAERVLDGLAQEERDLLADRWRSLGRNARVEKDW